MLWLIGCATHVKQVPTTNHATTPVIATKAGPPDLYPNPRITPGVTNPDVTQANIDQTNCESGWTATVRPPASYTKSLKEKGIIQYSYSDSNLNDYEEDHFIPLELAGSPTDPSNLWPEPYNTMIEGKIVGALQKDMVENLLKK